jgi:ADP-ribose pyrophosphatase
VSDRIERLEEILAYADPDNPWVRVYFDRVRFPDGREGRYNRIVAGDGRPGVAILPIAPDGRVALVRQPRYAMGEARWEIPRGYGEAPDPADDALRELREETGLAPVGALVDLGAVWPDTAVLSTAVRLFAATVDPAAPAGPTDGEILALRWFEPEALAAMLLDGTLADALTGVAALRAQLRGLLRLPEP